MKLYPPVKGILDRLNAFEEFRKQRIKVSKMSSKKRIRPERN
jgi:hypothetical protein